MKTKIAILDAAERAVRIKGYNGFSFDQIAREVGIQKASIYYYFASKAELVTAVFQRFSDMIGAVLQQIDREKPRAGDRLLAYIDASRDLLEGGESVCLSIALNVNQESLQPPVIEGLKKFHHMNVDWLTATFELGQRDGSITNIGDPAVEATASLGIVDGAQIMARAMRDVAIYDNATLFLKSRILPAAPA